MRKTVVNRWICAAAFSMVVMLGACAPAVQEAGGGSQVQESGRAQTASEKTAESSTEGETAVQEPVEAAATGAASDITVKDLLEAYNPHLGDASADGKLIGLVKEYFGIEQKSTMELQTSFPPYGLILHFEEQPDPAAVQRAAVTIMGLMDNCYSVSWDYPLDGEGNREYFYLPDGAVRSHTMTIAEAAYSYKDGSENTRDAESRLEDALGRLKEIEEPWQAKQRAETADQAVASAILEYNRYGYADGCEAYGEGHLILDMEMPENPDDPLTVYALTMYGGYQFQDGNFVKNGGTGVLPVMLQLIREPDGTFAAKEYHRPRDGGEYADSIKEMFPEKFWERCISIRKEDREELERQEREYMREYLSSIGREAEVGDYGDFPHTLLTDVGVSVEVSNQMTEAGKYSEDSPSVYAPFWLGNIERLEDGVRYVYEKAYDAECQEIIFTKTKYDTNEVMKREVYDSITGEAKTVN